MSDSQFVQAAQSFGRRTQDVGLFEVVAYRTYQDNLDSFKQQLLITRQGS